MRKCPTWIADGLSSMTVHQAGEPASDRRRVYEIWLTIFNCAILRLSFKYTDLPA